MLKVSEMLAGLKSCDPSGLAHFQTDWCPVKIGSAHISEGALILKPTLPAERGLTIGELTQIVEGAIKDHGRYGDWVYISDRDGSLSEPVIVEAKNIGGVIW